MNKNKSEFTSSARDEIKDQLEELAKHSGKEPTEIDPKPERFIHQRIKKKLQKIRAKLNATFIYSSDIHN